MQVLTYNSEQQLLEPDASQKYQLESNYYLPRIPPPEIPTWEQKILDSIDNIEHTKLIVRYQFTNNQIQCKFYLIMDSGTHFLTEIFTNMMFPVFGSISSDSNAFSAVFQKYDQQVYGFQYYSYIIYPCQQVFKLENALTYQAIKICDSRQKIQTHILGCVNQPEKEHKFKNQSVFQEFNCCLKYINLVENLNAQEGQLIFDEFQLLEGEFDAECLQYFQKKFKIQFGPKLNSFSIFKKDPKLICDLSELCNCVFMSYQKYSKEFVKVEKINSEEGCAFKVTVFYLQDLQGKKGAFKQLLTYLTPIIPIKEMNINGFDDQLIDGRTCAIQCMSLSAMNSVITFTYAFQKKVYLQVFHIQTGSCIKLSSESALGYIDINQQNAKQVKLQYLDQTQLANRLCKYLQIGEMINENEVAQYYAYYQNLFMSQILTRIQPQLLCQSYSLTWIVPNIKCQSSSVHIIKVLPLIPMEVILTTKLKMQKTDNFQRLIDFINMDKEFYQVGDKCSLVDYHFYSQLNEQLFFTLTSEDVANKLSLQQKKFNALNTDEVFGEPTMSVVSSTSCAEDITMKSDSASNDASPKRYRFQRPKPETTLILFSDVNTVPIFSNNEVCKSLNTKLFFKNTKYFNDKNYSFWQSPYKQIYQQTNNIFSLLEFHKSMSKVLKQYDKSNLNNIYDISQFAINQVLFSSFLYDGLTQQIYSLSIHPKNMLQFYKTEIELEQTQCDFSIYIRYMSDLIQQVVQLYQVQSGELISIMKALFGTELQQLIEVLIYDISVMGQQIQQFLLQDFIKTHDPQDINILPCLYFSLMKLGQAIQSQFLLIDSRSSSVIGQPFEYFAADYFYFQNMFTKYQENRVATVLHLVQNPIYYDFSKSHIISKMYTFTLYAQQSILAYYLESDQLFLKCLRTRSQEDIVNITAAFEQQQYYRIFDKSQLQIQQIINEIPQKNKEQQHIVNQFSNGAELIHQIVSKLCKIKADFQNFVQQQSSYEHILSSNLLNAEVIASDIIEKVCVEETQYDLLFKNENIQKRLIQPQWLLNLALKQFHLSYISEQFPYQFQNYCDLQDEECEFSEKVSSSITDVVQENSDLYMYKSDKISVFQKHLNSLRQPYQLKYCFQIPAINMSEFIGSFSNPIKDINDSILVQLYKQHGEKMIQQIMDEIQKAQSYSEMLYIMQKVGSIIRICGIKSSTNILSQIPQVKLQFYGISQNSISSLQPIQMTGFILNKIINDIQHRLQIYQSQSYAEKQQFELPKISLQLYANELNCVEIQKDNGKFILENIDLKQKYGVQSSMQQIIDTIMK